MGDLQALEPLPERLGEGVAARALLYHPGYPATLLLEQLLLVVLAAAAWALRERLDKSQINRSALVMGGAALFGQILLDLGFWRLDVHADIALASHLLLWSAITATGAAAFNPRLAVAASVFACGWFGVVLWPSTVYFILSLTSAAFTVGVALAWWREERG